MIQDIKPGRVEQAKFKFSPLGKNFNKRLDGKETKEGLLKKLKDVEGKNKKQLEAVKDQGKNYWMQLKINKRINQK